MGVWLLFIHILAGCVWVGGHLYLAIRIVPKALHMKNAQILLDFERNFEKIGMTALIVQVVTGIYALHKILPTIASLFDHSQNNAFRGLAILFCFKLTWLLLTFITAMSAQFLVLPTLRKNPTNVKLTKIFVAHILIVTFLSVLFVLTGVFFRTGLPF